MTEKTINDIIDNLPIPSVSENLYIPKVTDNVKLFTLQEEYLSTNLKTVLESIKSY